MHKNSQPLLSSNYLNATFKQPTTTGDTCWQPLAAIAKQDPKLPFPPALNHQCNHRIRNILQLNPP